MVGFLAEKQQLWRAAKAAERTMDLFATPFGVTPNFVSPLFSMGVFSFSPAGQGSHPQLAQISADIFMGSTHLLNP